MNNQSNIRLIIADDHDVYREGLNVLITRDTQIDIVSEASNGKALIDAVIKHRPDVVLTDLVMPKMTGIQAIQEISKFNSTVKCIALSTFDSEHLVVEAFEAGAIGYVVKNAQKGEIIEAIKTADSNLPYYCRSTSKRLVKLIARSRFNPYNKTDKDLFSEKEKEIIRLICMEKTSEEIGKIMLLGKRNVDFFRIKILEKMNAKTITGLVLYAIKNGLFSIED